MKAAATAGPGRAEAEAFAVIVSNAFDDTTESGIGHGQLSAYLAEDIHPEGRQWVESKQAFRGVSVIDGDHEDPWIRSRSAGDGDSPQFVVEFVVLLEVPAEETLAVGRIFRYWNSYQVTVRDDGTWVVVDYESSIASEVEVFSQPAWESVMDSGKGWRRFTLT